MISNENEIPKDAKVGEIFEKRIDNKFCGNWKIFKSWTGVVFANEINSVGEMSDGNEIILRKE